MVSSLPVGGEAPDRRQRLVFLDRCSWAAAAGRDCERHRSLPRQLGVRAAPSGEQDCRPELHQ